MAARSVRPRVSAWCSAIAPISTRPSCWCRPTRRCTWRRNAAATGWKSPAPTAAPPGMPRQRQPARGSRRARPDQPAAQTRRFISTIETEPQIGQRRRLLGEHRLDRLARRILLDVVLRQQIARLRHDQLDVLQLLEPLEAVLLGEPHALADDLEHIDDAERVIALMRAQL